MSRSPSVCPLDCPDRCSVEAEVVEGRIGRLHGTERNPITRGTICGKVAKFARRVHGPERVLTPLRRVGPRGPGARFERVGWDEAMEEIVGRFQAILAEDGPEALLPVWYGGSNGHVTAGGVDARLWARLGTTQLDRTLCGDNAGAGTRAVYHDLPGGDPLDVEHARGVLLWGVNPSVTGIHLVPLIRSVLDAGGQLAVVDPRRIPLAAKAVLHLAPRPGTDVAIAFAMARLAFVRGWADRAFLAAHAADAADYEALVAPWTPEAAAEVAGVRPAEIEALAELYATAPGPWMVRTGWGLERTRNGSDAVRAVLSLPAVYGKFGVRGGGYAMSTSSGYRVDKSKVSVTNPGRELNLAHLGRVLLEAREPRIRAAWIYDCNPVATLPDQRRVVEGLSREDLFVVVHEQSHTDTADYADLVLPATTFLEHHDLLTSYGGYVLGWSEPAIPPVGEARCNHDVMCELARRLGHADLACAPEDLGRAWAEAIGRAPAGAWDRLRAEGMVKLPSPVAFADAFPSRPITLCGPRPPRYRPPPADPELPLQVISPATSRTISSTLGETLAPGEARVGLSPGDAAARGLREGDTVRLRNGTGQATLVVALDPSLREGVACVPKGLWRRTTVDGWTVNALMPDHVDEHGHGPCYNDVRVELQPVGG